jgi:hypothetical protein
MHRIADPDSPVSPVKHRERVPQGWEPRPGHFDSPLADKNAWPRCGRPFPYDFRRIWTRLPRNGTVGGTPDLWRSANTPREAWPQPWTENCRAISLWPKQWQYGESIPTADCDISISAIRQLHVELDRLEKRAQVEMRNRRARTLGLMRLDLVEECRRKLIFFNYMLKDAHDHSRGSSPT